MSVSGGVEVDVVVDTKTAEQQIADLEQTMDRVAEKWTRTESTIWSGIRTVEQVIMRTVSITRHVFNMLGTTLTPIQEALVMMIQTTLGSILATHRAIEAGTIGGSALLTISLSIAAIAISAAALVNTVQGMNQSQQQLNSAVAIISDLQSLTTTFRTW